MHTVELYRKVRLACRDGMSERAAARHFGISRASVKKMLCFSVPPGYRRTAPVRRPKLDGFTEIIDQWLKEDLKQLRKQCHTAKRIFDRLRAELVKDYAREHHRRRREMFVPLIHPPGHGQADFGEARAVIGGVARALVHELMEARDERRLLRLQKQMVACKLLIIDELGFVPLSKTGAELLFRADLAALRAGRHAHHLQPPFRRMDRDLRHRAPDRGTARPSHPSRQNPRDERRQLPPQPEPRPQKQCR